MRLDPRIVKQQIENLRLQHPDLVEDDESWLLAIESETELDRLLTAIVRQIEDATALADGTSGRLTVLQQRTERFQHRINSLRGLAFKMLDASGLPKVELPEATLSIRKGQPKLVGEADPASLPDDYCKVSRTLDRSKIKDALKAGQTVPGFELSNSEPSLSIRIK
jgi:hypothetical protein